MGKEGPKEGAVRLVGAEIAFALLTSYVYAISGRMWSSDYRGYFKVGCNHNNHLWTC